MAYLIGEEVGRVIHSILEPLIRNATKTLQGVGAIVTSHVLHEGVVNLLGAEIVDVPDRNGATRLHDRAPEQAFLITIID